MTEPATNTSQKPAGAPPPEHQNAPAERLVAGAVDTHIHMLAAPDEFPLWEDRAEDPAPGLDHAQYIERYRGAMALAGIERVVLVHSISYGVDNRVTLSAMGELGRERIRAIGLVTDTVSDAELDGLAEAGVVGVRLNYVHGGVLSWQGVKAMASRLAARGMHVQMLMNAHKHMAEIADEVRALPVPVVFDHIGWPDLSAGPSEPGFERLLSLVSDGVAYVKLSGIYRLDDAPYEATDAAVAALVHANPERCLWGSDWPHIMLGGATTPDLGALVDAFHRVVTSSAQRRAILVDNPDRLYGFG